MNFFSSKKKEVKIHKESSSNRNYSVQVKQDFDFRLKNGDEIYLTTATIKKLSDKKYEVNFHHNFFLGVPENNPQFFIKRVIFTFNSNEIYSIKEIQNKFKKEELRSNISGVPFVADSFFISEIGDIIRNKIIDGEITNNYKTFKLNDYYWIFDYKTRSFERGRYYNFKIGKINTIFTSNISQKLPILKCIIESKDVIKAGVCDTRKTNGVLPKDFNWKDYNEIINNFGSIKKDSKSNLIYIISFSEQCRNLLKLREKFLPNQIIFYTSPLKKERILSEEMIKLNSTNEFFHPIADTKLKLIDANSIGKAIAMVLHGTSLDGPRNENFKYLKIANSFWLQLYKNQTHVAYLDLEHGMVRFENKDNLKNVKLFIYGYK